MEKLIIIGAGGYSKSVIDAVDYFNYELIGFIDEFDEKGEHLGFPILGKSLDDIEDAKKKVFFIAIGNNKRRKVWYDRLTEKGLRLINVVDKSAIVSPRATIGNGCFIGKMAIVNSKAIVGNNCIVNSRALAEHGSCLKDHVNISTGAILNGDVVIGTGSFIGSGSTIIGQLEVGEWSTVGAGAVVTKSIGSGVTAVGIPAKVIKEGAMLG